MPKPPKTSWAGSLHTSFRLMPNPSGHLRSFLESDGATRQEVLGRLPYDRSRSRLSDRILPDDKRYRDPRQVYETAGLLYDDGETVHITSLGRAVLRWIDKLTEKNLTLLGRHAAYGLAACQLQSPIGDPYDSSVVVFPFSFIWRAMFALDCRISSGELNRAIFKVKNEEELQGAIDLVRRARAARDEGIMGEEIISGEKRNDRIIPWMSIASFGWTLIADKRSGDESGYYTIPKRTMPILKEASAIQHKHRTFGSKRDYVEYIARAACLPEDLR
jgi:hypothetical protein